MTGSYYISTNDLIKCLFGHGNQIQSVVIFNLRFPRTIAAVISGGGLAVSGLTIQRLLKNPLASPFTIGISQGAAFGAAFAIMFFGTSGIIQYYLGSNVYTITFFAFIGSIISTIVIICLAKLKRFTAESVILAGVALSALFSSGTVLLQYFADEKELASIVFWTFGDIGRSTWQEIIFISVFLVIIYVLLLLNRWNFNALGSGKEIAGTLGVNVERISFWGMLLSALLAALITAFHGVIAFVGLLSPHIAGRLIGSDFRLLLPFTFIIGSILLLTADITGRLLIGSGAIPVGILTSFMGAPLFLYLLIKSHRYR